MSIPFFGFAQFDQKRHEATKKRRFETLEKQLKDTQEVFTAVKIHFLEDLQGRHDDNAAVTSARHFEMAQKLTEILHSAPCEDSFLYETVKDVCEELESSSNRWQRLFEDQRQNERMREIDQVNGFLQSANQANAYDDPRRNSAIQPIPEEQMPQQPYGGYYQDNSQEITGSGDVRNHAQEPDGDENDSDWGDECDAKQNTENDPEDDDGNDERKHDIVWLLDMMDPSFDSNPKTCPYFNTRRGCAKHRAGL